MWLDSVFWLLNSVICIFNTRISLLRVLTWFDKSLSWVVRSLFWLVKLVFWAVRLPFWVVNSLLCKFNSRICRLASTSWSDNYRILLRYDWFYLPPWSIWRVNSVTRLTSSPLVLSSSSMDRFPSEHCFSSPPICLCNSPICFCRSLSCRWRSLDCLLNSDSPLSNSPIRLFSCFSDSMCFWIVYFAALNSLSRSPLRFDSFRAALIYCSFLFISSLLFRSYCSLAANSAFSLFSSSYLLAMSLYLLVSLFFYN